MASNLPIAQLPTAAAAWVDPKTGLPTKEFALFMQALNGAFLSINGSIGSLTGVFLQKSLNLSDVASAPTSRNNLGLTAAAITPLNTVNGIPTLDSSGRYQAFGGELIANVQTYNVGSAPKVLTVIGCFYGGAPVGYGGGVPGTSLGETSYGLTFTGPYGSTPVLNQSFSSFASLPGSWQNITVQTVGTNGFGIWVRFA